MNRAAGWALLFVAGCATRAPSPATSRAPSSAAPISAERISAHVHFLAHDALEGRGTGERGYHVASRYVAKELALVGAEPRGTNGTFFQSVPLRGMTLDFAASELTIGGVKLRPETDYFLNSDASASVTRYKGPLVFVGYGVRAPEYRYDDTEGIDLKGKIAVALYGAPLSKNEDFFPPTAHAHYSHRETKLRMLKERGAVGVLIVATPELEGMMPWARYVDQARFERMEWVDGDTPGSTVPGLRGLLSRGAFEQILSRAGVHETMEEMLARAGKRELRGRDLGVIAEAKSVATIREVKADNVIGVVRGSDPTLASEHVVFSAHLDHLGLGKPVNGDAIYNGALDNASGCAAILEIARAFGTLRQRPKRSVAFLFVTAEEKGLLGSDYFVAHPTIPLTSIVADINVDGAIPGWPLVDVEALGAEHSTLAKDVAAAAAAVGVEVSPDSHPEQSFFTRSDQFSFVKRGVPSLFVLPGTKDETGNRAYNEALFRDEMTKFYHLPADEWRPTLRFDQAARFAKLQFLIGQSVANAAERPRWRPGDFYGLR